MLSCKYCPNGLQVLVGSYLVNNYSSGSTYLQEYICSNCGNIYQPRQKVQYVGWKGEFMDESAEFEGNEQRRQKITMMRLEELGQKAKRQGFCFCDRCAMLDMKKIENAASMDDVSKNYEKYLVREFKSEVPVMNEKLGIQTGVSRDYSCKNNHGTTLQYNNTELNGIQKKV